MVMVVVGQVEVLLDKLGLRVTVVENGVDKAGCAIITGTGWLPY